MLHSCVQHLLCYTKKLPRAEKKDNNNKNCFILKSESCFFLPNEKEEAEIHGKNVRRRISFSCKLRQSAVRSTKVVLHVVNKNVRFSARKDRSSDVNNDDMYI